MNVTNKVLLEDGPDPWAASVSVAWDTVELGWGRRKRSKRVNQALKGLDLDNYQTRYDNIVDATIIYFRNKDDAVSAYFYLS